jgi:hypothetical protein
MNEKTPPLWARQKFDEYLSKCGQSVKYSKYLGGGTDGEVCSTNRDTALKVLTHKKGYFNERDTYLHLKEYGVTEKIGEFWIPSLVHFDDDLMIVEMDIMHNPPYIIDFAKVRLFSPPDFSEDVIENSHIQGVEQFGENWSKVLTLLSDLESFLIYYLDPRPSNIVFTNEELE